MKRKSLSIGTLYALRVSPTRPPRPAKLVDTNLWNGRWNATRQQTIFSRNRLADRPGVSWSARQVDTGLIVVTTNRENDETMVHAIESVSLPENPRGITLASLSDLRSDLPHGVTLELVTNMAHFAGEWDVVSRVYQEQMQERTRALQLAEERETAQAEVFAAAKAVVMRHVPGRYSLVNGHVGMSVDQFADLAKIIERAQ